MDKIVLFIILSLITNSIFSQQINPASGSSEKEEFSAEWIIGGSLIDNSILSVGQETTGFENIMSNNSFIEVNPTATRDFVNISFKDVLEPNLNFKIMNGLGIKILNGYVETKLKSELDVRNFAAGYYLIIFITENDLSF
jgi:hypothetical protein